MGDNRLCIGPNKWHRVDTTAKTFARLQAILCVGGFAVFGEAWRSAFRADCRVQLHGSQHKRRSYFAQCGARF